MPRLFGELELANGDGRFPRVFKAFMKTQLLILDDWAPDRLDTSQRRDLMETVKDRYEVWSTLITSQRPIHAWHNVIGEAQYRSTSPCAGRVWFREFRPSPPRRKDRAEALAGSNFARSGR